MHVLKCARIHAQIQAYVVLPTPYLLPQPTLLHAHSLRGKEEMSFLRIEYSGMSFATLTLHMQNPVLCIHVERHKTGTTIKNVISLPMVWPRLSAENFHHQYR